MAASLRGSRGVIDGPGHIPAVDLDGKAVSRVAAWSADFVFEVYYPIPGLVIESRKHLRRPPPDCRRMLDGDGREEDHRSQYKPSVDHPILPHPQQRNEFDYCSGSRPRIGYISPAASRFRRLSQQ